MAGTEFIHDLFGVEGRKVLITGATQGLGAMMAEGFLKAGAAVWIVARKRPDIDATIARLSEFGSIGGICADIATPEGIATVAASLGEQTDALDILINNAGTAWAAPIEEHGRDKFEKVVRLNLTTPYDLTRAMVPFLRAASRPGEPSRVINISSVAGMRAPDRDLFGYTSSKAGLHMLTQNLAAALAPEILVNCIAPGFFESRMNAHFFDPDHPQFGTGPKVAPAGRYGQPIDIMGAAIYLASPASQWLTGVILPVAGGSGTADGGS